MIGHHGVNPMNGFSPHELSGLYVIVAVLAAIWRLSRKALDVGEDSLNEDLKGCREGLSKHLTRVRKRHEI